MTEQTAIEKQPADFNKVHAHRCENCAARGIHTVWLHADGSSNEKAHACPRCGNFEWKKWLVPVGQLPQIKAAQHAAATMPAMPPINVISLRELVSIIFATAILYLVIVCVEYAKQYAAKK